MGRGFDSRRLHHLLFSEFVYLRIHRGRSGPGCAHFVPRVFGHGRIQAGNPVVLDGRCQVRVAQRHLDVAVADAEMQHWLKQPNTESCPDFYRA